MKTVYNLDEFITNVETVDAQNVSGMTVNLGGIDLSDNDIQRVAKTLSSG